MPATRSYPSVRPGSQKGGLHENLNAQSCLPQLEELVFRFHGLLVLYRESLSFEASPSQSSCDEWSEHIQDLQWALVFIINEVSVSPSEDQQLSEFSRLKSLVYLCDDRISDAISSLGNSRGASFAEKITEASEKLQDSVFGIEREISLRRDKPPQGEIPKMILGGRPEVKKDYEQSFTVLTKYLDGDLSASDLRCLLGLKVEPNQGRHSESEIASAASRKVFLNASLFAFMSPAEWIEGTGLHRLARIQERVAAEKLTESKSLRYLHAVRLLAIKRSSLLTGRK
jgi:hypothetical protein